MTSLTNHVISKKIGHTDSNITRVMREMNIMRSKVGDERIKRRRRRRRRRGRRRIR